MDIQSTAGNFLKKRREKQIMSTLQRIDRDTEDYCKKNVRQTLTILYGPSFSIYTPVFIHDRIFSNALRLRGARIVPMYCDAVQHMECNVYGGVWGGGKNFKKNCANCVMQSENLWQNSAFSPIKLSSFISEEDRRSSLKAVSQLRNNWVDYQYEQIPFGRWALDILVNNYLVQDYRLIKNHEILGLSHLRNLLLLYHSYLRILNHIKPDRVISNDSYYGMWATLQVLAQRQKIPFYSHWSGTRTGAWCYAYNDASMNLNFRKSWKKFSRKKLTTQQIQKVDKWLKGRKMGKDSILDTSSLKAYKKGAYDFSRIDFRKPIALLSANVIWDLSALNKQIFFDNMIDWIIQTIRWFSGHPEYQLIIKPHPAEVHPSIPKTRQSVESSIMKKNIKIPGNVFLLPADVKMTVYQFFPLVRCGLVYTSTVGVEMSACGIPVITSGKSPYRGFGLTADPDQKKDYFTLLESILKSGITQTNAAMAKDKAYKYILFNFFHYYSKIHFMDNTYEEVQRLKINSVKDILPGKNKYLDYMTDSIMKGWPILDHNRWPPESE